MLNRHEAPGELPPMPRALPAFKDIKRYWSKSGQCWAARILPGEFYVSTAGELVVTILGSCVSACIRDPKSGVGGMNHFMLPFNRSSGGDSGNAYVSLETRYGSAAMEQLINEILKNGGRRENLEVKLFGGGRVLEAMTDIGEKNIAFARSYLRDEGLNVVSEDLGGTYPRKVRYFTDTGRVQMKRLERTDTSRVANEENQYLKKIEKPAAGPIDLF